MHLPCCITYPEVVEGIACDELQKNLIGKRVTGAGRKAKHLWLEMGVGGVPALYLHFGMTGSIILKSPSGALTAAKYDRCALAATLKSAWTCQPGTAGLDLRQLSESMNCQSCPL